MDAAGAAGAAAGAVDAGPDAAGTSRESTLLVRHHVTKIDCHLPWLAAGCTRWQTCPRPCHRQLHRNHHHESAACAGAMRVSRQENGCSLHLCCCRCCTCCFFRLFRRDLLGCCDRHGCCRSHDVHLCDHPCHHDHHHVGLWSCCDHHHDLLRESCCDFFLCLHHHAHFSSSNDLPSFLMITTLPTAACHLNQFLGAQLEDPSSACLLVLGSLRNQDQQQETHPFQWWTAQIFRTWILPTHPCEFQFDSSAVKIFQNLSTNILINAGRHDCQTNPDIVELSGASAPRPTLWTTQVSLSHEWQLAVLNFPVDRAQDSRCAVQARRKFFGESFRVHPANPCIR